MKYCLPSTLADEFLNKIKSGEIEPGKLSSMSSEARRNYFAAFLGEMNAREVNSLFESKLLLKNQQQGMINWAKKITGIKPAAKRDLLTKVETMTEILTETDKNAFLEDLAATKLKMGVTMGEAGKIAELSKIVTEKRAAMEQGGDRLDYGRAVVAFHNYTNDLKLAAKKKTAVEAIKDPLELLSNAAGYAKAMKSTLDNSALLRQGWKTLFTHPGVWQKNARKSFVDMYRTFGGAKVMDELNADIVSRPTYDKMKQAKLDVGKTEEAFPTSLPEKIPIAGKFFKASENAYTAFLQKTRADVFDIYLDIAEKSGVDTTDQFQLESIGKLVNSLTGRGHLGKLEPVGKIVNNVFFSPRNLKSNIDTLLMHPTDKMSKFARKRAAINLMKIISGTAAILAIAKAVAPKDLHVEMDPRSSDFGKIRYKNTTFDVSGGMSSIITLAARLINGHYKSSTTGKVKELNTGDFGTMDKTDVIYNFFEGKLSPAASVARDLLKGQDFSREKITFLGELRNLAVPMPVSNFLELRDDPESANILLGMIADSLGIGVNTYTRGKNRRRR